MNKAILFDFDGTFMDTQQIIWMSYGHLFEKYRTKEEFTKQLQVYVLGPTLNEGIQTLFPGHSVEQLKEEYRNFQRKHITEYVQPMQGSVEVVKWLKEKGYKVGVVSSRSSSSMKNMLQQLHIEGLFDVMLGNDQLNHSKPHPEGIIKALNILGVRDGFYVGDSTTDIEAAHNARIGGIAFVSNDAKEKALEEKNPEYLIHHFEELKFILK